jgi:hypothetical protein
MPIRGFSTFAMLALATAAAVAAARKPHARIDHIILGAADLDHATQAFEGMTGVRPVYGGKHPTGTHNALVSLGDQTYLEIIAVQPSAPPPASLPNLADFESPTPIGWAVTADDGSALRYHLVAAGFEFTENEDGARTMPSGTTLHWQTFGLAKDIDEAPFFILWTPETPHPSSTSPSGCSLKRLAIMGPHSQQLSRLKSALDLPVDVSNSHLVAMTLELSCPKGTVVFKPIPGSTRP